MTYAIVIKRSFYGERDRRDLASDDSGQGAVTFASRRKARQHIEEYLAVGCYREASNEYGPPAYRAVAVDQLPQYLQWQL